MLIGQRILSIFLIAILLLTLLPLYSYAAENSTTDHAGLNPSVAPKGLPFAKSFEQPIKDLTRWDIYEIVFGTLLLLVGFALTVLAVLRWQANDLTLIVVDYQHV